MKLIKKRESSVELDICGYNIERTLNYLCSLNVEFCAIEKKDIKHAKIKIKNKYLKIVKKTLKNKNIEIINEKINGFYKIINLFKFRVGLTVGIILSFCLLIIFNNFLFQIKVQGNENVSADEIVSVLNENGINVFTHLNDISTKHVEKIVLDNFKDISMVSVIKKGTSIIVNVKEKLLNDEYENLNGLTPLLSTQNGMITNIKLVQGTLLVKVGDIVKVGTPLVAPYVVDASGKQIAIIPKAEIMADVWLSASAEHCEVVYKTERTGNFVSYRETSIFNSPIFSNVKDCEFSSYETEVKESYLSDSILPIKYKEIFYFETKCVIIEQEFEEVKNSIIEKAKHNAMIQVGEADLVLEENYSISEKNGKYVVEYVITTNKNIAV